MKKQRYTCQDIADLYGVSVQTIWRWIHTGKLTAIRIGGLYYIRQSDLDAMEARQTVNATPAPEGMAWT